MFLVNYHTHLIVIWYYYPDVCNDVYVVSKDGEPDQLFAAIEEVVKDIDVENKLMIVDPPEWI